MVKVYKPHTTKFIQTVIAKVIENRRNPNIQFKDPTSSLTRQQPPLPPNISLVPKPPKEAATSSFKSRFWDVSSTITHSTHSSPILPCLICLYVLYGLLTLSLHCLTCWHCHRAPYHAYPIKGSISLFYSVVNVCVFWCSWLISFTILSLWIKNKMSLLLSWLPSTKFSIMNLEGGNWFETNLERNVYL